MLKIIKNASATHKMIAKTSVFSFVRREVK